MVETSPSNAGVLIWSLVKELPYHMPTTKKPTKQKQYCNKFNIVVQLLSSTGLCNYMDCSMPGFPVLQYLLEFALTHVHWVYDAIQPSHRLLPSSPPALNLSQHQGLFQWVGSSQEVAKVLEFQLQHQSFRWTGLISFKIDWFDLMIPFISVA